jgi:hypothetical protein
VLALRLQELHEAQQAEEALALVIAELDAAQAQHVPGAEGEGEHGKECGDVMAAIHGVSST